MYPPKLLSDTNSQRSGKGPSDKTNTIGADSPAAETHSMTVTVTTILRGALCLPLFGMLSQTLSCSLSLPHSLLRSRPLWILFLCLLHVRYLFTCYLPFITCL